jgi:hypothetical protein
MAGISFISLDATKAEPIAIIALAGFAGYLLYVHLQSQKQANAQQSASDAASYGPAQYIGEIEQMDLLNSLLGGSSTTGGTSSTTGTNVDPALPTYSSASSTTSATNTSSLGTTTTAGSGA